MELQSGQSGGKARASGTAPRTSEERALADGLFQRNENDKAQQAYLKLLESAADVGWCHYQLGRIAVRQKRWPEAVARFDAAIAEPKPFIWNHYEKALVLEKLKAAPAEIVRELVCFVRRPPKTLEESHYAVLLRNANEAFKAGLYDDAGVLYDWLSEHGQGGYACNLRRAEVRLQKKELEDALRIANELKSDPRYDLRGEMIKARVLVALERYKEGAAILKSLVSRAPDNINFVRSLFHALERGADKEELSEPDQFLRGLPKEKRFEFLLKARLICEDYEGIAKLHSEYPAAVTSPHVQLVSRAIHGSIQKRDFSASQALFETAGGIDSNSPRLVAARVLSLFVQKDFDAGGRLLQDAERLLNEADSAELRLRKLEFFCLTMQLAKAKEFLAEWGSLGDLPAIASSSAAGLYAALGQWDDVFNLFHDRIRQGFGVSQDVLLESIARATRRTGRYAEILEQLDELLRKEPNEDLTTFRDRMLSEIRLVQDLGLPGAITAGKFENSIDTPLYAHRAKVLSRSLSGVEPEAGERNIYFCSDTNYLAGTCVALFTLLRNNFSVRKNCSVGVVCDDEVLEFATSICERIGATFSVPVRMRAASSLLGDARNFKSGWGLFTPGHGLSDAAYYRIFMAQRLLAEGVTGRALYIDSDVCVGRGIQEMFEFDLQGHPLGARPETALPEIIRAAIRLGIEPAKYFNSGVLLFDMSHPDLPDALNRAVDISLNQQEILTFVDQCALNVAFQGRNAVLPDVFNFFLRETAEPEVMVQEPVVLHFLARPKPWDPTYAAIHCMRWVREFALMGELLTPEMQKRLLAVQFGKKPPRPEAAAAAAAAAAVTPGSGTASSPA